MAAKTDSTGNDTDSHATLTTSPDRRHAPRVLVNLDVDYGNQNNFLFANIRDISATGIFVSTSSPEPPGTRLNVRFTPSSAVRKRRDTDTPHPDVLDVEGEVIWVNAFRPGDSTNLHPGMGIRFVELTDSQRQRLHDFIKTFAYLADE